MLYMLIGGLLFTLLWLGSETIGALRWSPPQPRPPIRQFEVYKPGADVVLELDRIISLKIEQIKFESALLTEVRWEMREDGVEIRAVFKTTNSAPLTVTH